MSELMRELKKEDQGIETCLVTPQALARLLALVEEGAISGKIAKTVFMDMIASGKDPDVIVKEKGLIQISDTGSLEALAREILAANPKEVADYQGRQNQGHGLLRGRDHEKDQGPGQPQGGESTARPPVERVEKKGQAGKLFNFISY